MTETGLWKLAPVAVAKPWGLVHGDAANFTGIGTGLGELWLASAQTGPGNYSNAVVEPPLRSTLAELLGEAAEDGPAALELLLGKRAAAHLGDNPHRGKTEAWHVRAAAGRTGLAAGPGSAEDARRLEQLIQTDGLEPDVESWSEEVRRLLGLIEPLEGGEVFLVPAGTLHTMFAVGKDSCLIIDEVQQGYGQSPLPTLSKILMVQNDLLSIQVHPDDDTVAALAEGRIEVAQDLQANPTVRVYDFGRRPGEYPELGFKLVDADAGLRRVEPVKVDVNEGQSIEVMLACPHFVKSRIRLRAAGTYDLGPRYGSYRVLHCLCDAAELSAGGVTMPAQRGDTVFVPAQLEDELRITVDGDCALFDDAFPDVAALTTFLGTRGVEAGRIEALLDPPRALPADQ
ncbi:MAG: hypothetical protein ACYS8L_02530 [Planctomycetota bacterium]|jgi:mannose-6-phosphate isomerase class I